MQEMIFEEFVDKEGMKKGVLKIVNGEGKVVGEEIQKKKEVEMMQFKGQKREGKEVQREEEEKVKRVQMEIGGKQKNIVLEDRDMEKEI